MRPEAPVKPHAVSRVTRSGEQHQLRTIGEREVNGARRPVVVNETESPLGWLKSRKDRNGKPLITDHNKAGERACRLLVCPSQPASDLDLVGLGTTATLAPGSPSNPALLRDEVIAAKERVMRSSWRWVPK